MSGLSEYSSCVDYTIVCRFDECDRSHRSGENVLVVADHMTARPFGVGWDGPIYARLPKNSRADGLREPKCPHGNVCPVDSSGA